MRSLYWLTAVTLVAAAVTTVAIADYGRRHAGTAGSWWGATTQNSRSPQGQEKTSEWVTEKMSGKMIEKTSDREPILPPLLEVSQNAVAEPAKSIRIEDVPEHQQLRTAALNNLASTNLEIPALPPASTPTPVVDEFTYTDKPLTPLYVPIQPNAKVVIPPAEVIKDVVKLPTIPGVSLSHSGQQPAPSSSGGFASMPSYRPEPARGPEVLPGLHAAATEPSEFDNPVADSITALSELVSALNPAMYLLSLPVDKKAPRPTTKVATSEVKDLPLVVPTVACDDLKTCPAVTGAIPGATCCEACASDEIVVRTYSIADFATTSGTSHDDLIRLISTMVAPDSWKTRDSTIEFFPQGKCLVVRHRASVQQQVDDLLSQLRGQVHKTARSGMPAPVVRREPSITMPVELELLPCPPREQSDRIPRVITNEPQRVVGDDEFFGMIPMRLDGRLMPVPMSLESSALVPAQFQPKSSDPVWLEEGPAGTNVKPRTPEFFPWYLPYAPLPSGPDSCEEQVHRVGHVNYTDDEIALFFLLACEWEESR